MLDSFRISRTFYKLTVRMYVDVANKAADMTVSYDRRLVPDARGLACHVLPFERVATPELAESYLGEDVPDYREAGAVISRLESMERHVRRAIVTRVGAP